MKELDKEFDKQGFHFEQIKRAENVALYKKYKIGQPRSFHYEVVYILSHNGYTVNNTNYPPSEYYPHSEGWGKIGFTYYGNKFGEELALKKFEELLAHNTLRANTLEEK